MMYSPPPEGLGVGLLATKNGQDAHALSMGGPQQ